eukprot:4392550-Prymnesium_polylepis.1
MYGRPDHRVGVVAIWVWFFTAGGGSRTLACDHNQVYSITARKGLTPARLETPQRRLKMWVSS